MIKICTKCKNNYPKTTEFFAFHKKRGYWHSWCRQCTYENTNKWRNKIQGVYGIYEGNECLYVGESSQVKARISFHKSAIKNPQWCPQKFDFYKKLQQHLNLSFKILEETDNHLEREKYYINKLKPKYNAYGL